MLNKEQIEKYIKENKGRNFKLGLSSKNLEWGIEILRKYHKEQIDLHLSSSKVQEIWIGINVADWAFQRDEKERHKNIT